METLLKYLGVFFVLIGVGILVYYTFATPSNNLLIAAGGFMLVGLIEFIFVNKRMK